MQEKSDSSLRKGILMGAKVFPKSATSARSSKTGISEGKSLRSDMGAGNATNSNPGTKRPESSHSKAISLATAEEILGPGRTIPDLVLPILGATRPSETAIAHSEWAPKTSLSKAPTVIRVSEKDLMRCKIKKHVSVWRIIYGLN